MKRTSAPQTQVSNEQEVFHILYQLHHTAEGYDGLPAWMLRLAAPVYARIIALVNRSGLASYVPRQWKIAIISPVAKIPQSNNPADYRPISITPGWLKNFWSGDSYTLLSTWNLPKIYSQTSSPLGVYWIHHRCGNINHTKHHPTARNK